MEKIKIVYSFSNADKEHLKEIKKHFSTLRRKEIIIDWDRSEIAPGSNVKDEIQENFYNADIIILLFSPDYFGPEFKGHIGTENFMARRNNARKYSRVIPIHLRETDIDPEFPEFFTQIKPIPRNGWIVDGSKNNDKKYRDLVKEIKQVIYDFIPIKRKSVKIFSYKDIEKTLEKQLFDHFTEFNNLSDGNLFNVFKAKDKWLNRHVIIKAINPWISDKEDIERTREKAKEEILAIANYNHRNIKRIFFGTMTEELTYVTMEYVKGESLKKIIEIEGPQPLWETKRLLLDLLDAIHYGHQRGAVHDYINPENIYIDEEIKPVISPFRVINSSHHFIDETSIDNLRYWSPEKLNGQKETTEKSDQFSLGLIGFELVTGKPFFDGKDEVSVRTARKNYREDKEILRNILEKHYCSDEFIDILVTMLSIDEKKRFKDLYETRKEIKKIDLNLEEEVQLVIDSCDRSFAAHPDLVRTFYDKFFNENPEAHDYFDPDISMEKQYYKLHHSVRVLLIIASKFHDRNKTLKNVAQIHQEKKIPVYLYEKFMSTFIEILSENDKEWKSNPKIGEAWTKLSKEGIEFMKNQKIKQRVLSE